MTSTNTARNNVIGNIVSKEPEKQSFSFTPYANNEGNETSINIYLHLDSDFLKEGFPAWLKLYKNVLFDCLQEKNIVFLHPLNRHTDNIIKKYKKNYKRDDILFIFVPNPKLNYLLRETYHQTVAARGREADINLRYRQMRFNSYNLQKKESPTLPVLLRIPDRSAREEVASCSEGLIIIYTDFFFNEYDLNTDTQTGTKAHLFCSILQQNYNTIFSEIAKNKNKPSEEYIHIVSETWIRKLKESQTKLLELCSQQIRMMQKDIVSHNKAMLRLYKLISEKAAAERDLNRQFTEKNKVFLELEKVKINISGLLDTKYSDIKFLDNKIEATTKPIIIAHKGKQYYIGTIHIEIDITTADIKFKNRTNSNDDLVPGISHEHPHIRNQVACFGNTVNLYTQLINKGEYMSLLALLHEYLCQYNAADPYLRIEDGWGGRRDICPRCNYNIHSCHCDRCRHCNELVGACNCPGRTAEAPRAGICPSCNQPLEDCMGNATCERCEECGELPENCDCQTV